MTSVRYAVRALLNNPVLAAVSIVCLALGIGANTAIFTVVNAVVLRPLPFKDPDKLFRIYTEFPTYGSSGGFRKFWMSTPELLDLRRLTKSWESMEAYTTAGVNLATGAQPVRVTAAIVTGGMLPMLGVPPQRGRALTPEDGRFGAPLTLVISDGLWRRAFGGEAGIIGREVKINGLTASVVGVMPRGFAFPPGETDPPELWYPQQINPANPGGRSSHFQSVIGRLNSGATIQRAREELELIMMEQGKDTTPNTHMFDPKFHTVLALAYHGEVTGNVRPAMLMIMGAVGFVLLIACVNVGNLLLARAEARHHEIAIRKAIGANIWDLMRLCLMEGLLLAVIGAAAGLLFAWGGLRLILAFDQAGIPRANEIGIDWTVLAFTAGVSVLTAVFFGLAPMAQFIGDTQQALKTSTGRATASGGAHLLRRLMVVSELALALILLAGAGLMIRTFWKLQQVNIGLNPSRVITMRLALPEGQYAEISAVKQLWTRLLERVRSSPGVESASILSGLAPLRPLNANDTRIEGYVKSPGGPDENVDFYQGVAPGYFEMMQIPLLEGRTFDSRDGAESPPAVIINQTMARMFYGNQSPIGRRVEAGRSWRTIVGVVADVKNAGIEKPAGTELYFPYSQAEGGIRAMFLAVKGAGDPRQLVSSIRAHIADLDPSLPVAQVRLMEDVISSANVRPRFLTVLLSLFAVIALILAAVGMYSVMAFMVARRTQEFGIRMAIGAGPASVLNLVLTQGMRIGLIGVVLGALGAFTLTRFMRRLLFGVEPFDPLTFGATAVLLSLAVLAACYIPARRATRVDPLIALRYE